MEDYYQNLIRALPDIVYQLDIEGNFVYINDSIQKLGYGPNDLLGKHFDTIIAPGDRSQVNRLYYHTHQGGHIPDSPSPRFFSKLTAEYNHCHTYPYPPWYSGIRGEMIKTPDPDFFIYFFHAICIFD